MRKCERGEVMAKGGQFTTREGKSLFVGMNLKFLEVMDTRLVCSVVAQGRHASMVGWVGVKRGE